MDTDCQGGGGWRGYLDGNELAWARPPSIQGRRSSSSAYPSGSTSSLPEVSCPAISLTRPPGSTCAPASDRRRGDQTSGYQLPEVGRIFRQESGRSVATLIRAFGDIDLAEDAVQEAFALALRKWPADGLPPNPGGWITTTARNYAIDRLRRQARGQ